MTFGCPHAGKELPGFGSWLFLLAERAIHVLYMQDRASAREYDFRGHGKG